MHRNIRLLYLHNLLTDFRLWAPFTIIYFEQVTARTQRRRSFYRGIFCVGFIDIPTGIFSDKVGRKYTLFAGSAIFALAYSVTPQHMGFRCFS